MIYGSFSVPVPPDTPFVAVKSAFPVINMGECGLCVDAAVTAAALELSATEVEKAMRQISSAVRIIVGRFGLAHTRDKLGGALCIQGYLM